MVERDKLAAEICDLFWDLANWEDAPVDTSQPEAFIWLFDRYAARWLELQQACQPIQRPVPPPNIKMTLKAVRKRP